MNLFTRRSVLTERLGNALLTSGCDGILFDGRHLLGEFTVSALDMHHSEGSSSSHFDLIFVPLNAIYSVTIEDATIEVPNSLIRV